MHVQALVYFVGKSIANDNEELRRQIIFLV